MPFPRKRLMFEQVGVDQKLLDQLDDLKKFLRGIDDTSPTWLKDAGSAGKAFMPNFSALYNLNSFDATKMKFNASATRNNARGKTYNFFNSDKGLFCYSGRGINAIYKVNVPGFVYRQHFKGGWNAGPEVAVFVSHTDIRLSKATAESLNWICLYRSRGIGNYATDTAACNNANNFFPINPGSNTHLLVITSGKMFNRTAAERQALMYIPAFGYTDNPINLIGEWKVNENTLKTIPDGTRLASIKDAFK